MTDVRREPRVVSLLTMGCARNDVDSEELAGRLAAEGWTVRDGETDGAPGDVVVVNTCGFIDAAKKDSIDAVLAASDSGAKVVAVGCLAQRYGAELAEALPEATVLGFDDYAEIGDRLDDVLAGRPLVPHTPGDRRTLLPISPVARPAASGGVSVPGHEAIAPRVADSVAGGPTVLRRRLAGGPTAPLKLASGCDRRCTFCAIPSFRGAFVSRPPADVLAEAAWLAADGVREVVLVSENSTSYGKDLGDVRLLEQLLPRLGEVDGLDRWKVAYLQPAEIRPGLLEAVLTAPKASPYLDISFQHSSPSVLRRMRRFGSTDDFLGLLERARALRPDLGVRSNVIVGFPGETEDDLAELERFLVEGRLDVVGVFGYSDEDGTEAATYDDKVDPDEVDERVARVSALVEELTAQRAEDRIGEQVRVLVEHVGPDGLEGRVEQQGPEVDGTTRLVDATAPDGRAVSPGDVCVARVVGSDGIDLLARIERPGASPGDRPGRPTADPVG